MEPKKKVLFVCKHNSARSQMAEALLNDLAGDRFEAMSAGIEPGTVHPLAIEVMKEIGLDISQNETKRVFDLYRAGKMFQYVIAVCDRETAEKCPIFPGINKRLDWSFPDPASFTGTTEEQLEQTRLVRSMIEEQIRDFIAAESD
ncbi:MAG: arsenate reductase ArsC [Pyrinomonadaceae bacterium]